MSQLFIQSRGAVRRPGVFAIEVAPPRIIRGVSLGTIGYVGRFAWGPVTHPTNVGVGTQTTGYLPESGADFVDRYEPAGSPRNSTGYYGAMRRLRAPWFVAGIKGAGYAVATLILAGTGGNLTATAKYPGVRGNSILLSLGAASNGDTAARDITATMSDPNGITGTTTESFKNAPLNGVIDVSRSKLLSSLTFSATLTAWPANVTNSPLTGGSDGAALTAADYQNGLDALALNPDVTVVVTDDCGDAIRTAVNQAVLNHLVANGDRVGAIMGPVANAWAAAKTDKAGYSPSRQCKYYANWTYVRDDAGNLQLSPQSTMWATARVNIDRFVSAAWRDPSVAQYYSMVDSISANFQAGSDIIQDEATDVGIDMMVPNPGGGYVPLHDRTMSLTSGYQYMTTRFYKIWLAKSLLAALPSYVNGPNAWSKLREIKGLIDDFLERERLAGALVESFDKNGKVVPAYSTSLSDNTASSMALGQAVIAIDARNAAVMEQLFLQMNVGEGVTVREAA